MVQQPAPDKYLQLTPKRRRFVAEFLECMDATEAAKRAGYSYPNKMGYRLVEQPAVKAALKRAFDRRKKNIEANTERILEEYAKIAFANIKSVCEWDGEQLTAIPSDKLSDDHAAAIAEVKQTNAGVTIKMHDKSRALEMIAKHLGMFIDRHEHQHEVQHVKEIVFVDRRARRVENEADAPQLRQKTTCQTKQSKQPSGQSTAVGAFSSASLLQPTRS